MEGPLTPDNINNTETLPTENVENKAESSQEALLKEQLEKLTNNIKKLEGQVDSIDKEKVRAAIDGHRGEEVSRTLEGIKSHARAVALILGIGVSAVLGAASMGIPIKEVESPLRVLMIGTTWLVYKNIDNIDKFAARVDGVMEKLANKLAPWLMP